MTAATRNVERALLLVGLCAAILSFATLADLAYMSGITGRLHIAGPVTLYLAWLFPLALDAFAVVATIAWVRSSDDDGGVGRFAMRCAVTAILTTVAGNGYHGFLSATPDEPWIVAVAVKAVAPIALGALVHLISLLDNRAASEPVEIEEARRASAEESAGIPVVARQPQDTTGLYRVYSAGDELLYVGISNNVARRFDQHRRRSPWWKKEAAYAEVADYRTRGQALRAEVFAIERESPKYNRAPGSGSDGWLVQEARPEAPGERLAGPVALHSQPVRLASPDGESGSLTAVEQPERTDAQLVELVQRWAAKEGEVPSRERIRVRYTIGSDRAGRVRTDVLTAGLVGAASPDRTPTDQAGS